MEFSPFTSVENANGCCLLWLATLLLLSMPMALDIVQGGDEFFEGRREAMVGGQVAKEFSSKWPSFPKSLATHLDLLFLEKQPRSMDAVQADGQPLVAPEISLPGVCGLLLLSFWGIRARRPGSSKDWNTALPRARLARVFFWWIWIALGIGYCAYWNPFDLRARRLLVLIPLAHLAFAEFLDTVVRRWPGRSWDIAFLLSLSFFLPHFAFQHARHLREPSTQIAYRLKTLHLCAELEKLPLSNRYAFFWDWRGHVYFGDSPPEEWAEQTAGDSWDSWPCRQDFEIQARGRFSGVSVQLEPDHGLEAPTHLLLGTRFATEAEAKEHLNDSLLRDRLSRGLEGFGDRLQSDQCQWIRDSVWFSWVLCPLNTEFQE